MASGKRKTNESFKAYRERLITQSQIDKILSQGRLIWDTKKRGTYERARHGAIGESK